MRITNTFVKTFIVSIFTATLCIAPLMSHAFRGGGDRGGDRQVRNNRSYQNRTPRTNNYHNVNRSNVQNVNRNRTVNTNGGRYYHNGQNYRYYNNGQYYNYRYNGNYYRYFVGGEYYNYLYNGEYYTTCTTVPYNTLVEGTWVSSNMVCN